MINKDNIQDISKLSPMQENIFFYGSLQPHSTAYHITTAYKITGKLDVGKLQYAFKLLIQEHPVLRTVFTTLPTHGPLQVILRNAKVNYNYIDHRQSLPEDWHKVKESEKTHRFDLQKGPLVRLTIIQLSDLEWILLLAHHHIILDGWSSALLIRKLADLYISENIYDIQINESSRNPFLQYTRWVQKQDELSTRTFWTNYLSSYENTLRLSDFANGNEEDNSSARIIVSILDSHQYESAKNICTSLQITMSTFIKSAWAITLCRLLKTSDIIFANVVTDRPSQISGIDNALGLFINTVPVRFQQLKNQSLGQALTSFQAAELQKTNHQYYSTANIMSLSMQRNKLLDHALIIENYELKAKQEQVVDVLSMQYIETEEKSTYPFNIFFIPKEQIEIRIEFDPFIYDSDLMHQVLSCVLTTICRMVKEPNACMNELFLECDECFTNIDTKVEKASAPITLPNQTIQKYKTGTESELARLWQNVLNITQEIDRDDNFFEIGGTSINVIDLFLKLQQQVGKNCPSVSALYSNSTLRKQAMLLEKNGGQQEVDRKTPLVEL